MRDFDDLRMLRRGRSIVRTDRAAVSQPKRRGRSDLRIFGIRPVRGRPWRGLLSVEHIGGEFARLGWLGQVRASRSVHRCAPREPAPILAEVPVHADALRVQHAPAVRVQRYAMAWLGGHAGLSELPRRIRCVVLRVPNSLRDPNDRCLVRRHVYASYGPATGGALDGCVQYYANRTDSLHVFATVVVPAHRQGCVEEGQEAGQVIYALGWSLPNVRISIDCLAGLY